MYHVNTKECQTNWMKAMKAEYEGIRVVPIKMNGVCMRKWIGNAKSYNCRWRGKGGDARGEGRNIASWIPC